MTSQQLHLILACCRSKILYIDGKPLEEANQSSVSIRQSYKKKWIWKKHLSEWLTILAKKQHNRSFAFFASLGGFYHFMLSLSKETSLSFVNLHPT
jgi:hypothetical protein